MGVAGWDAQPMDQQRDRNSGNSMQRREKLANAQEQIAEEGWLHCMGAWARISQQEGIIKTDYRMELTLTDMSKKEGVRNGTSKLLHS